MNTYLINYTKRDIWLSSNKNFDLFLRQVDQIHVKERKPLKKARQIVKKALWRSIRKGS